MVLKGAGMNINSQKGMTTTLSRLFIVGFVLTLVLSSAPIIWIIELLQGAIEQVGQSDIKGNQIHRYAERSPIFLPLTIFAISRRQGTDQDAVTRGGISLDYEKRIEMFGNVDVVLKFSDQFDSAEQNY